VVSNNHLIGFNAEAGVKVEKEAFPAISCNKIYKNYKEGVLVVENSSALIEKNEITHNVECNIALGGKLSHHSAIIDNVIADSPGSGLQLVRAGRVKVLRNDISGNQDGIIMSSCEAEVQRNHIFSNRNNGIVCEDHSCPTVTENFITRNFGVGLLLRHNSGKKTSILHSNIIASNEIDAGMQDFDQDLLTRLLKSNTIEKDIYYPEGLPCCIM
jgi:F-box protein 11